MRAAVLIVLVLLTAWPQLAQARPVRIRGDASLRAQAQFIGDREVLELRGRLSDDRRDPVEGATIELSTKSGLELGDTGSCRSPRSRVYSAPDGLKVLTEVGGEFCLRWREAPDEGTLSLRFAGDEYHGGAELEVSFDRARAQKLATVLRFDPRPLVLDLDKEQVVVSGVMDLAQRTAHAPRGGHRIRLFDERSDAEPLAEAETSGDGKVRFTLPTATLAGPGRGKLVLKYPGDDALAASEDEQPITRRASVRMSLLEDVPPADPGDTATVLLRLEAARGTVDSGVVEGLVDGMAVGTGPVVGGEAQLTVALDVEHRGPTTLSVRYVPSSPFYKPGPMLEVTVPMAPPSILLRVVLAVLVVAAGAWVTVSWRRSKKLPKLGKGRPMLTPGVHVVKSRQGQNAWQGTVVDAHDGHPLTGVTVLVRAPSLDDDGILVEATTDERGSFAFELDARPEGAELVAKSRSHAEERKALPTGGTLRIALITRRRAIQRRLVNWARVRGRPYDHKPDPTPGHVREAAVLQNREEVERWARAVEHAAFGPDDVDEVAEDGIHDLEPGPH